MNPLFFQKYGQSGPEIVILHGLFGSSKNWASVANKLKNKFQVYVIDQRNHGESNHHSTHSLDDLVQDLCDFINLQKIQKPILLGHSMGGMCAMSFALANPENISALIVVDIAPKKYTFHHQKEFELLHLDVSGFRSRKEIENAMKEIHESSEVIQFLMMNLDRNDSGFQWKINTPVLEAAHLVENAEFHGEYSGPALFLKGQVSPYITQGDFETIHNYFPASKIVTIAEAGHWMHHSHQQIFLKEVLDFLG